MRLFDGKMYWIDVPEKNLFCLEMIIKKNTIDNANINIWTYSKKKKIENQEASFRFDY